MKFHGKLSEKKTFKKAEVIDIWNLRCPNAKKLRTWEILFWACVFLILVLTIKITYAIKKNMKYEIYMWILKVKLQLTSMCLAIVYYSHLLNSIFVLLKAAKDQKKWNWKKIFFIFFSFPIFVSSYGSEVKREG